jgi:hypothetical protein
MVRHFQRASTSSRVPSRAEAYPFVAKCLLKSRPLRNASILLRVDSPSLWVFLPSPKTGDWHRDTRHQLQVLIARSIADMRIGWEVRAMLDPHFRVISRKDFNLHFHLLTNDDCIYPFGQLIRTLYRIPKSSRLIRKLPTEQFNLPSPLCQLSLLLILIKWLLRLTFSI